MKEKIIFYFFKIFSYLILFSNINTQKKLITFFLLIINKFKLLKKKFNIMKTNLNYIFPDLSNQEIKKISNKVLFNLSMNIFQIINNFHLKTLNNKNFIIKNEEIILNAFKENKKIIFITAHYNNWELLVNYISLKYKPMVSIYKKLKHKNFDNYLLKSRTNSGLIMKEKNGAIKFLIKALKDNKPVGLLIDQSIKNEEAEIINFLGKETNFISSASYLSRMTGAIIIPVYIHSEDYTNYIIEIFDEIKCDNTSDKNNDIKTCTIKQAKTLEKMIYKYPENWFWIDKRWRHNNKYLY